MIKIKLPMDKTRFLLELIKYNSETLIKNMNSGICREFIEINFKKGLVILNSPYLSSMLSILIKNGQNIFQSLHTTHFITRFNKTNIINNLCLLGTGFLSYVRFIVFTSEKFKISKINKILKIFVKLKLKKKKICTNGRISCFNKLQNKFFIIWQIYFIRFKFFIF